MSFKIFSPHISTLAAGYHTGTHFLPQARLKSPKHIYFKVLAPLGQLFLLYLLLSLIYCLEVTISAIQMGKMKSKKKMSLV